MNFVPINMLLQLRDLILDQSVNPPRLGLHVGLQLTYRVSEFTSSCVGVFLEGVQSMLEVVQSSLNGLNDL